MSLPTPPSTSHRDKENRLPPGSRISWSQHNQYHSPSASPHKIKSHHSSISLSSSSPPPPPPKSILKKSSHVLLPFAGDDNAFSRETTPEPADPLTNLSYLANPVENILTPGASLRNLIEAYSVLAARLKKAVAGTTDTDASWPLFQPLRRRREAIVDAFVRDLARALVDPAVNFTQTAECEPALSLPSPKTSPGKRRTGMTAEQVKYARDLCTTSHAVIKLLAVVFTLPAVYRVFSDEQLRSILTQVLAIPLADDLPTPNARKTCALSIWLLQTQRLPAEILVPAKDRIAYALQRGIDGELGKEGKKGSANDGLKAIHELSTYQPTTFLPAFIPLLPSILANLLAPTLTLRTQACHALGGLVLALISLPTSSSTSLFHSRLSASVASFLTTAPTSFPTSPSSPSRDPLIIRTIRTTLQATDPVQSAQGPVWGLVLLASLTILLGPRLCSDMKLSRTMTTLLSLSMRHRKSSVRGLGCLVWRCVTWVWFQPAFPRDEEDDDDDEGEKKRINVREAYWRVLKSVVDVGAGVATIAALLHNQSDDKEDEDEDANLKRVLEVMKCMIKKGGQTCGEAMDLLKIFVSFPIEHSPSNSAEWTSTKLLPPSLFNALPGLLTAEYKSLVNAVKPVFEQCPQLEDVRSLTREEVAKAWVFDELVGIWRKGLCYLEMPEDCGTPTEVLAVWEGLLRANVFVLQDAGDDAGIAQFAIRAADILVDILLDTSLDLTTKTGPPPKTLSSSSPIKAAPSSHSSTALKLSVTRDLWTVVSATIPQALLIEAGQKVLACLMDNEDEVTRTEEREQWAMFCADVLFVCDTDDLKRFWGGPNDTTGVNGGSHVGCSWKAEERSLVWTCFLRKWREARDWNWEGAVVLLGVPFVDSNAWELNNNDFTAWDDFLEYAINKALDYGVDSFAVLDHVACAISQNLNPAFADSARVADLLLKYLEIGDARQIPSSLLEFVNDTLLSTYPPEPRNKVTSSWLLRSLTRIIDACPAELALNLFETIQDGLSVWVSDSYTVFSLDEYEYEIVPLYQTLLLSIRPLPHGVETLKVISIILESAFWGREDKPSAVSEAFTNFWNTHYSSMEEPVSGWPVKIQNCLRAVSESVPTSVSVIDPVLLAEDAAAYDADISQDLDNVPENDSFELPSRDDENDNEALPFPESEDEASPQVPASPKVTRVPTIFGQSSFISRLGPAFFTPKRAKFEAKTAAASEKGPILDLQPPSTPAKAPILTSTPPRPQKSSAISATFLAIPRPSPITPLRSKQHAPTTPKRTPFIVFPTSHSSPSKHRQTGDKENMSPRLTIASFAERLALRSPAWSKESILGKRQAAADDQGGSVPKRVKLDSMQSTPSTPSVALNSEDIEDEKLVEYSLVDQGSDDTSNTPSPTSIPLDDPFTAVPHLSLSGVSDDSSSMPSPRKRKRVFMESVEVLTLREIIIRERKATTPQKTVLRRTRSATLKSSGLSPVLADSSLTRSRKRSKRYTSNDPFLSSPVRALEEMDIAGSDDSINWVTKPQTDEAPSELSSDDDPHIGQVTPHHLISPTLRRVQDLSSDPPSDDSNMSASPSRDLANRRKRTLASFSYLKPSLSS